jgi:hypothetical protein
MLKIFKKRKFALEELIKMGVISALMEVIYVVLVAAFFMVTESLFPADAASLIMGIIAMLILLVLSASISGILIFGIPFYFASQKKYHEAGVVFVSSVVTIVAMFILIILGEIFIY